MTTQPELIRQSDLLNELVLNRNTMEEIGRVEVLWMYPQAHRVLGFICKSGLLGNQKYAFQLSQIDALGDSGVLTRAQPEKTEAEKVRQLESLIGLEIWSDEGNRIGKITDCLFNLRTGEITHYLFVSSGWTSLVGEIYQLPPAQIQSVGKRRVLVSEAASHEFALYQAGLSRKLTQAGEALKEEAAQEWSTIARQAETTTEQAKTRAQQFSQQFKQTAQVWNDQVKEKTQTWLEQAKEKSQILAERVKESTQALGEQLEERIETLTVPSDEKLGSDEDEFALEDFDLEADWFDEPSAPSDAAPPVNAPVSVPHPPAPPVASSSPPPSTAMPLPPLTMPTMPAPSGLPSEPVSDQSASDQPVSDQPATRGNLPQPDGTPEDDILNDHILEDDDDPWI
jgi:uncharacterized protein YrrD